MASQPEPMFNPREVAGIIQQSRVEQLQRIQQRILLVERFGADAVTMPMLGRPGTDTLAELIGEHDAVLAQIRALQKARDAASEADILAFVDSIKRRK